MLNVRKLILESYTLTKIKVIAEKSQYREDTVLERIVEQND